MTRSLLAEGDFTGASGYSAMQKLMNAKPDAVFVASDLMAVGAMRAARNAGFTVLDDVAFAGFDDLPIATQLDCPLITVRQLITEFGFRVVETLMGLIESRARSTYRITVETELIVRDSCGASQRMRR